MINIYSNNRKRKTKMIEFHERNKLKFLEQLNIFEYNNATVLPAIKDGSSIFGLGGVIDSHGDYVEESGIKTRFGGKYKYNSPNIRIRETSIYLGFYSDQWGHFLMESISRMWYLNHMTDDAKFVFSVYKDFDYEIKGNVKILFELLNIYEKIIFITEPTYFDHIIIPELGYSRDEYWSKQYECFIDKIAELATADIDSYESIDKIYLSRSFFDKAKKSEIGLDMLDNYFQKNGYRIIYPEKVSLPDLICYMRNAKQIASTCGSISHNLIFASKGASIILVDKTPCINEYQTNINIIKDFHVTYIDCFGSLLGSYIWKGPFLYFYNASFRQFTSDMNYYHPDNKFISKEYLIECVKKFYTIHYSYYNYRFGIEEWQLEYSDLILESYYNTIKEIESILGDFDKYFNHGKKNKNVIIWLIRFISNKKIITRGNAEERTHKNV